MTEEYASRPAITIDGSPLDRSLEPLLERVIVDDDQHVPDMFVITLRDPDRGVLERARIRIGSSVRISGTPIGSPSETPLITGEVTALEGEYEADGARLIIRGYDLSHRFLGARHSTTYRDVTDADIARTIAGRLGVPIGQVDDPGIRHEHVSQADQSDWEFLRQRAASVDFVVSIADGRLDFRRRRPASEAPAEGDYRATDPQQLVMGKGLLRFSSRVTSAEQVREVEIRGWDPERKEAVVAVARAATDSASVTETPEALAGVAGRGRWIGAGRHVVEQSAADAAAAAAAEAIASSFVEADGVARGHPALRTGSAVSVSGVASPFAGRYLLTHTRHIFDDEGYRTHFVISGRQDRSLLGLTAAAAAAKGSPGGAMAVAGGGTRMPGLMVAIVTDNLDPAQQGRVRIRMPTLADDYESGWARVVQPGAGPGSGLMALPDVGDEVIVGFEHGDISRPYVLGGVWNGKDKPRLGDRLFDNGHVRRRGFISRAGHRLVFLDDDAKAGLCLLSADDGLRLALNQTAMEIHLHSDGRIRLTSKRDLELEAEGSLSIKAAGKVSIQGDRGVDIKSPGAVDVDGTPIRLN
jgi:phage protein D